ncbi:NADH dehydrogenase (ubiquinone) complex I, assembly factor 6 homolog sicily isoform X2 [Dermacentor variabilis]|uniref:NADH dehydrogenase (ubiquinone) complex I, assembly factor 6 homolog sicily isoform X2 n=1 Tax=Dermacentor variabilis TaxID=34621 RepID=UPI003F5B7381
MFRISLRTTAQYGNLQDKCIYYRSRVNCKSMSKLFKSSIAKRGSSPAAYCMDQVKQYDYENYLCSLLLPAGLRRSAFAIRAFNVELAQIRDIVSRADIGLMRIRFWKDAVEMVYKGNPPEHPVAQELSMMVQSKQLSRHWISRMIESRESILSDKPHSTVNELEEYAEKSVSSTLYFILQAMGVQDVACDHVASHIGKLQGLTNLIRGIPFNAAKGRVYLPSELMAKHKVSQESVARGKADLKEVIYDIACTAHQHLATARSLKKDIPRDVRLVYLPAMAPSDLKEAQKRSPTAAYI